jgi:hypothetical protein
MAKVWAYRCARTGLYYPGDYAEQWGRKYGKGLGPTPVSEALVNIYQSPVPQSKQAEFTMHPIAACSAQVDLVQIDEAEYAANRAVLQDDDPDYRIRAPLMRQRQLVHSDEMAKLFPTDAGEARAAEQKRTGSAVTLAT